MESIRVAESFFSGQGEKTNWHVASRSEDEFGKKNQDRKRSRLSLFKPKSGGLNLSYLALVTTGSWRTKEMHSIDFVGCYGSIQYWFYSRCRRMSIYITCQTCTVESSRQSYWFYDRSVMEVQMEIDCWAASAERIFQTRSTLLATGCSFVSDLHGCVIEATIWHTLQPTKVSIKFVSWPP